MANKTKPIARIVVLEGGQTFPCVARVLVQQRTLYTSNIYPVRHYEEAYRDAERWARAHGYRPTQGSEDDLRDA